MARKRRNGFDYGSNCGFQAIWTIVSAIRGSSGSYVMNCGVCYSQLLSRQLVTLFWLRACLHGGRVTRASGSPSQSC